MAQKREFSVPTPQSPVTHERFNIVRHKSDEFHLIKDITPIYSFQYISLQSSPVCFNGYNIAVKDFHRLFDSFKKYSTITYAQMRANKAFHFHEIIWDDVELKEIDFLKCLTPKITDDVQTPTVYQFDVFEEARIIGFIYCGVFYAVWLDRNHLAFNRQNRGKNRR